MITYLITNEKGYDEHGRLWKENTYHREAGEGKIWEKGWIRTYENPNLAAILHPLAAEERNPLIWECLSFGAPELDHGLHLGWKGVKTLQQIAWPSITSKERMRFAVTCVSRSTDQLEWLEWTESWLNGNDKVIWPDDGIVFAIVKSSREKELDLNAILYEVIGY